MTTRCVCNYEKAETDYLNTPTQSRTTRMSRSQSTCPRMKRIEKKGKENQYKHSHKLSELPHIFYNTYSSPGTIEADNAAGDVDPLLFFHHSGHCPSFPPPGQKQLVSKWPIRPAVLQTGFSQMRDDFAGCIEACNARVVSEDKSWSRSSFWLLSSTSKRSTT